ncbi:DUF5329 family protein [Adhaeribacter soli]|uniref:DUF5329 domain-containing protein n=1 Tax=Adhaeribacter soli TaxID=2607655 RepID=A0A5N1IJY0_9BACT|nr:DUF5329 family protein [Adhaeribacter soli]KAA9326052.1 hypothetical protein F0P94_16680 [Adhaeribacter soli]
MHKLFTFTFALLLTGWSQQVMAQQGKTGGIKPATVSARKLTEDQKIEHLINYIRGLEGATFIRNGSEYSAKAAAEHLELKRKNAGSRIKTARQFIDNLASESSMSGKKYQIRMKEGKTYFSRELLLKELERIEK